MTRNFGAVLAAVLLLASGPFASAQAPNEGDVIRGVDAAVHARLDAIESYTVTEHYSVFRHGDETNSAAEMTVKTTYRQATGKSYEIISESGSSMLRKFVLDAILDREKQINQPGTREGAYIVSANYEMKLKPAGFQIINGRGCLALEIHPRQKAPNLVDGLIWVDKADDSLVRLQGIGSKTVSMFTQPAQMTRDYSRIDGFSMATRARAATNSTLLGPTVVTIEYTGYQIQLRPR